LWEMRNLRNFDPMCRNCGRWTGCRGGGRCVAFGYFGNEFAPDPQCWQRFKKLPKEKYKKKISAAIELNEKYINVVAYEKNDMENESDLIEKGVIEVNIAKMEETKRKIMKLKSKNVLLSIRLTKKELNRKIGEKIFSFLNELRHEGVEFKVTRPMPRCLFGFDYEQIVSKFSISVSCKECLELFKVQKNGMIQFCKVIGNKIGPRFEYMRDRNQIYEYFKTFYDQLRPSAKCRSCIYLLRKRCDGLCFRKTFL
jgi:hypothetical protein